MSEISVNGIFATLKFEVSSEAPDNYEAKITVTYDEDDVCDSDLNNISLKITNGKIDVFHGIPGDIDGDRKVNNKDAILLFRYVAGWDIAVDSVAVDVNGDGKVNNKDAITLFRYVAGWSEIEIVRGCAHEMEYTPATSVSCTENGNIEYWRCSKCGKYFSDANGNTEIAFESTAIPATGHTVVIDEAVAPTCKEAGLTQGEHCLVCNSVLVEQSVVPATGHKYSDTAWAFDNDHHWREAVCGCEDAGIIEKAAHTPDSTGKCTICGYQEDDNYIVEYYWQDVTGDDYTIHERVPAYAPVGSIVSALVKSYDHFVVKTESVSSVVNADGSTILKVYYDREVYTVTFDANGGKLFGSTTQRVRYGGSAEEPEFERDADADYYYTFNYYAPSREAFENVTQDVTITVYWTTNRKGTLNKSSITGIDDDVVSWTAVDNASKYIISAGDYSFETSSQNLSCALSNLNNADGNAITTPGKISVYVTAVGNGQYKNSVSDPKEYFYVPKSSDESDA